MKARVLSDWLENLEAERSTTIKLGLSRCKRVKANLKLNKIAKKVIAVAGTNGKGSSVALMESVLLKLGYEVGTYTSPHIRFFNERIKINGEAVSDKTITDAFCRVDGARGEVELTPFEFCTLAAFSIFESFDLDYVVLEVGLGGRLDAVNSIDPDLCLVTSIDFDHQEFLGSSREEIGYEKAGIMRKGIECVCSDPAVPNSIVEHAHDIGARLKLLGVDFFMEQHDLNWDWWDLENSIEGLSKRCLSGEHQLRNAAGVIKVIALSEGFVSGRLVNDAISDTNLEGRFQEFQREGQKFILDVAHNREAAKALSQNLLNYTSRGKIFAIVALMKTKEIEGFLLELAERVDFWIFPALACGSAHSNALLKKRLLNIKKRAVAICCESVGDAIQLASKRTDAEDVTLVCGSFITVGEALKFLESS